MLAAAEAAPDDVEAQTAAADVEVLSEQIQAGDRPPDRLGDGARPVRTGTARAQHLLELFSVLDPEDERIVTGRRSLTNALY